jgi:hypothetical protein
MSYAQFGLVEATDFNTLAGGNPTSTANTLNVTWATGSGQAGYGQTAVANVASGQTVSATNWAAMVNNTASAASHQGSSITAVTAPVAGGIVTYLAAIPTNLQTIYASRGNAATQGTTTSNTTTNSSTAWTDYANFTFTTTFANGDAARYFFNAGGQLKFTCSHSNTDAGINSAFNALATATGTMVISGQNSGSRTIVGVSYNGVTKVGGSGSTETLSTNSGYFGLSTANTLIFDQNSGTAPYTATVQIQYLARTNGVQGSNADNGSVVTVHCLFDKISGNGTVGTGSSVTCTLVPPEQTNISNTWGTVTLAGSVTAA